MKKILGIIFSFLLVNGAIFAQKANGEFEVRTGGYFQYQPVLGKLGNYVTSNIGGGLKAEFDLPVNVSDVFEIGVPVNIGFGVNPVTTEKADLLDSMMNVSFSAGIYGRIILMEGSFIIQPELDYGLGLFLPQANTKYPNELDSVYADQTIQFLLGFRYVPQSINNGMVEFELAPWYSMYMENGELVQCVGGKLGAMIRIY